MRGFFLFSPKKHSVFALTLKFPLFRSAVLTVSALQPSFVTDPIHMPIPPIKLPTAATFANDISKHLKSSLGKSPDHASDYDWRMALSFAVRDHVVDPWFESTRATYAAAGKRVYYLSLEFLIGRLIEDITINLGLEKVAAKAMEKLGQN